MGCLGTSEMSLWEFAFGVLGTSIALAFGHIFSRCDFGFLDAVCIHQTDTAKKTAAIKALPGFVIASEKLFVMWEPAYLTRGWCCFEIAVFKALKPDGEFRLFPLELYMLMLLLSVVNTLLICLGLLIWLLVPGASTLTIIFSGGHVFGPMVMAGAAEKAKSDRQKLVEQLETFDIEAAEIHVESDRALILEEVEHLFEDGIPAFNKTVRVNIRKQVVEMFFAQRSLISYPLALIPFVPMTIFWILIAGSFRHSPWEFHAVIALYAICYQFAFAPCVMATILGCSKRWAKDSARRDHMEWWSPLVSIKMHHIAIGFLIGVTYMIIFPVFLLLPATIASGKAFFGLRPWHAVLFEVVHTALWFSRVPSVFKNRKVESRDQSIENEAL